MREENSKEWFRLSTPRSRVCALGLNATNVMQTREEIECVLREELDRARSEHEQATIGTGARSNASTREVYAKALREFNEFILHGVIPERLKEHRKASGTRH